MKKTVLLALSLLLLNTGAFSQTLLHYWNFNNATSQTTLLTPTVSLIAGSSITHVAGGTSTVDFANGTGQGFDASNNFNARNGDSFGSHLRFNNPIGGMLVFALPTTGYKDVIIKFTTRRSGSGAGIQTIDYTTDGTNYLNFTTILPADANPQLQTLDFTNTANVSNNPNFKIRISFAAGAGGTVGNNRFDNFTVDGNSAYNLLHYWNFNNATNQTTLLTPSVSLVAGSSITHVAGGTSAIDPPGGTGQNFDVSNFNARNSDGSGTHLRFNNPIGGKLVFAVPTTGYKDLILKYSTRRSGSGAGTQTVEYTTDGTNYINFTTITVLDADPVLQTLDFRSLTAVNNNPNFKIRISFSQGGGGTVGNNRFDNFTADGIPTADQVPLSLAFSPLNNATGIQTSVQPTLTFNKDVRLINNTALDNSNVDNLIELRLNNAAGALVAFDASVSGRVITVVPAAGLSGNQTYYVALQANVIEDIQDNALSTVQSAVFTTAATSISFQNRFVSVNESAGSVNINLLLQNPSNGSVDIVLKGSPFSNTSAGDLTFANQTLTFTGSSAAIQTINIPINNDALAEIMPVR